MSKRSFTALKDDASRIKNETGKAANTATRIGGMFEDIVDTMEDVAEGNATIVEELRTIRADLDEVAEGRETPGEGSGSIGIDKTYNPSAYSGLGRVYLKKNMVGGKNVLEQDAFYTGPDDARVPNTNTIFVIEYDFDLDGEKITVPENCVLEFDGGSIVNGLCYGNNTVLVGKNSQKGVLVGLFRNSNNELVDGTGNVLKPDLGFDFAADASLDLTQNVSSSSAFYAQSIIHTGKWVFVLANSQSSPNNSYILRYDTNFNYYGYVSLSVSQVVHGGIGYYKDGYLYIASHIDNTIVKFSVSAIANAEAGSSVSGEPITISSLSGMTIIFMSYDYNNNTILMASGSRLVVLNEDYQILIDRTITVPDGVGTYWQDVRWYNGVVTLLSCYNKYGRMDPVAVYYDIYSNTFSDIFFIDSKYQNVEMESAGSYIGHDGTYLICGNNAKKGCIVIGKYSNITQVNTLDKGMTSGYETGLAVYVKNVLPSSVPEGGDIDTPNGTSAKPFKNITSATYFYHGQFLLVYFLNVDQSVPFYLPRYIDNRMIVRGDEANTSNRPTVHGKSLISNVYFTMQFVNYVGTIRTESGTINVYDCTLDGNGADYCLRADSHPSKIILNKSTVKNANKGVHLKNSTGFVSDYANTLTFQNLTSAIYVDLMCDFKAPRFYFATFDNVTTYINDNSLSINGIPFSTYEFIFNTASTTQFDTVITLLDKCTPGLPVRIYNPADFNDRPKGVCTFLHKTIIEDTKGTLVGPNGSTLPIAMTTEKRTTTINRKLLVGDHTFDVDLGKEVYWDGEGWVDATGADPDNT